jgi:hypothetical protein
MPVPKQKVDPSSSEFFSRTNDEKEIVFECEDTGPRVDRAQYLFKPVQGDAIKYSNNPSETGRPGYLQNSGLGLYSVATQISSLGGRYGYAPRSRSESGSPRNTRQSVSGSIFWFSIPLQLPQAA